MEHKAHLTGHLTAVFTIIIWGITFTSTKVLLSGFTPIEILFFRFLIGFLALFLFCPHLLKLTDKRQEWLFAAAGLTGVTLYFLLENIALTYTTAANVGVIISAAPFFTAVLSCLFLKGEKPSFNFYIGFIASMAGIFLISWGGTAALQVNPLGDLLALLAALLWAVYSVITKKISSYGYSAIQSTRRTFFYGLIFMLPALYLLDFHWNPGRFSNPTYLLNILFLGLFASAVCFVTWGITVRSLGAVKASAYIYGSPVVTIIASSLVLNEQMTWAGLLGTLLTLSGLIFSELRFEQKKMPVEALSEATEIAN